MDFILPGSQRRGKPNSRGYYSNLGHPVLLSLVLSISFQDKLESRMVMISRQTRTFRHLARTASTQVGSIFVAGESTQAPNTFLLHYDVGMPVLCVAILRTTATFLLSLPSARGCHEAILADSYLYLDLAAGATFLKS
jgi:hypothetical protein